ncbi:MAG: EAL domain-containing protein [Cellvibrionaceae bacterium]|nr:EAL domain-containing protein [Cellvibrionaceae bacterium]
MNRRESESNLLIRIKALEEQLQEANELKELKALHLANSEERFALAMRSASDGLWDWDLKTDYVYYSPCWKTMLGYEEHELEDNLNTWSTLTHPDDVENALAEVEDYLIGKLNVFEFELRMRHKNGGYLFIRSRAFKVVCEATGEPLRLVGTHVNITEQKQAEIFNRKHAEVLEMIAKGHPAPQIYDAIALLYESRNPGMRCSMLELRGDTLVHGSAPSLPKQYCDDINGIKYGPNVGSCGTATYTGKRVISVNIETDPKWVEFKDYALPHGMRCCWSEPILSSSGKVLGAFGMYHDYPSSPNENELQDLISAARLSGIIMEREKNLKKIRDLAFKDTLTGLSSRAQFYLTLEKLTARRSHLQNNFSILYLDLDNFKHINDSMGHDAGDMLLQAYADRLRSLCQDPDLVGRLSGDEFCIIVDTSQNSISAETFAKQCLQLMSSPIEIRERRIIPSCSIGIAHYPEHGDCSKALLKAADTALYRAKDLGKNRYTVYNSRLTQKVEYKFKVEHYLKQAINDDELTLAYQPQLDLVSEKVVGVEALLRWHHPVLGQVSPVEFVKTAERIGRIYQVTEWVLTTACNQLVEWDKSNSGPEKIAVNISSILFQNSKIVPLVTKIIDETGLQPNRLELEITENAIQTSKSGLETLKELKSLGVMLAIDDFGTGYSSFSSLRQLEFDILKLDKSFVDEILQDKKAELLIRSIIIMSHDLGTTVVAEGVEKRAQANLLHELGCDMVQGYLYSKAIKSDYIPNFIAETNNKVPNWEI